MSSDKIAVLADIHGNRWALEAVLEDLDRREIKQVFNLGDCLYGPLDPAGTVSLLMEQDFLAVSGNEDRIIHNQDQPVSPTLAFVCEQLSALQMDWIKSLPGEIYWQEEFYLTHGSPGNDQRYFLEYVRYGQMTVRSIDQLTLDAADIDARVILVAHSHLPRVVVLLDDKLVVNPGSVGLQAYWDNQPESHEVENNSPQARFSILHRIKDSWRVEQINLNYDWETAAKTARKNKRLDWAYWLRTGFTD